MIISLCNYRRRIVIGTVDDIVLTGTGVMPRHAELVPAVNGSGPGAVVLRPLDGEVWVEHGPVLTLVNGDHVLVDGDVIVIANYRLRYRNVGARPPESPAATEVVTWLK